MTDILEQVQTGGKKAKSKAKKKEDQSSLSKQKYYTELTPAVDKVTASSKKAKATLKQLQQELTQYHQSLGKAIAAARASKADAEKAIKAAGKDKEKIAFLTPLASHSKVINDMLSIQEKQAKPNLDACAKIESSL